MRVLGIKLGFNPATLLAGMGAVILAPSVIAAAPKLLRSAAKSVIKAGYIISDKMRIVYWDKEPSIVVGGGGHAYSPKPAAEEFVYVSNKGKKYHKKHCQAALQAQRMLPLAEAVAAGYEPCRVCGAAPPNVETSTEAP